MICYNSIFAEANCFEWAKKIFKIPKEKHETPSTTRKLLSGGQNTNNKIKKQQQNLKQTSKGILYYLRNKHICLWLQKKKILNIYFLMFYKINI